VLVAAIASRTVRSERRYTRRIARAEMTAPRPCKQREFDIRRISPGSRSRRIAVLRDRCPKTGDVGSATPRASQHRRANVAIARRGLSCAFRRRIGRGVEDQSRHPRSMMRRWERPTAAGTVHRSLLDRANREQRQDHHGRCDRAGSWTPTSAMSSGRASLPMNASSYEVRAGRGPGWTPRTRARARLERLDKLTAVLLREAKAC